MKMYLFIQKILKNLKNFSSIRKASERVLKLEKNKNRFKIKKLCNNIENPSIKIKIVSYL